MTYICIYQPIYTILIIQWYEMNDTNPMLPNSQMFESFFDGFISPSYDPELPDDILKASMEIAIKQFEVKKWHKVLSKRTIQSYPAALNSISPTTRKPIYNHKDDFDDKFCDIHETSEEFSDLTELLQDSFEPLQRRNSRFLSLRKSFRNPMYQSQQSIRSNVVGNSDRSEYSEIIQSLRGMQRNIDLLMESVAELKQSAPKSRDRLNTVPSVHFV